MPRSSRSSSTGACVPPELAEQIASSTSRPDVASTFTGFTVLVGLVGLLNWAFSLPTRKSLANGVTLSVLGSLGGAAGVTLIIGGSQEKDGMLLIALGLLVTGLALLSLTLGTLMIREVGSRSKAH